MAFSLFGKNKKEKEIKKKKKPTFKEWVMEWVRAIVFAVVVATVIRWALISAYTIPTSSMEGTQLVGDFLFVSKFHYGPRTPRTILRIPLTDNKIWGTSIPSYLSWVQLPIGRVPGLSKVKERDIVVFNFPDEEAPVDMKTHYIKRCVAIAGDTLQIKDTQIYINGKAQENAPEMQHYYKVVSDKEIKSERIVKRYDLKEFLPNLDEVTEVIDPNEGSAKIYKVILSEEKAKKLKKKDFIRSVTKAILPKDSVEIDYTRGENIPNVYPHHPEYRWNQDNYGPLVIPKKGMTIPVNRENMIQYGLVIKRYEWQKDVEVNTTEGTLSIDGQEQKEYTFTQDYFFMMGDNRHNSLDSRFWGFVPQDHVVGQALITWLSLDYKESNIFNRIRWGRMFTAIR